MTTTRSLSPRQEALALIAQYRADFNDWGGHDELCGDVWSPFGIVWKATGSHCIALNYKTNRPAGWRFLVEDLRAGVEPCTTPACEGCQP